MRSKLTPMLISVVFVISCSNSPPKGNNAEIEIKAKLLGESQIVVERGDHLTLELQLQNNSNIDLRDILFSVTHDFFVDGASVTQAVAVFPASDSRTISIEGRIGFSVRAKEYDLSVLGISDEYGEIKVLCGDCGSVQVTEPSISPPIEIEGSHYQICQIGSQKTELVCNGSVVADGHVDFVFGQRHDGFRDLGLEFPSNISSVATSGLSLCVVFEGGSIKCLGDTSFGQLENPMSITHFTKYHNYENILFGEREHDGPWENIAVSEWSVCASLQNEIYCSGVADVDLFQRLLSCRCDKSFYNDPDRWGECLLGANYKSDFGRLTKFRRVDSRSYPVRSLALGPNYLCSVDSKNTLVCSELKLNVEKNELAEVYTTTDVHTVEGSNEMACFLSKDLDALSCIRNIDGIMSPDSVLDVDISVTSGVILELRVSAIFVCVVDSAKNNHCWYVDRGKNAEYLEVPPGLSKSKQALIVHASGNGMYVCGSVSGGLNCVSTGAVDGFKKISNYTPLNNTYVKGFLFYHDEQSLDRCD